MADTLITDLRTPTGTYKTIRRLGRGGMAEVFLSEQEGMAGFRRLVVVKKILPQFSEVSSVAEMLFDEARIAAQLVHPNIVQIYEPGKDDDGQHFIVMEYIDGCDLATLARIERHRGSRIPMRLTIRVVSEAAMGLDYAHRQVGLDGRPLNIVHRDVSPHNIMCSREGSVKVTDFGIAKAVGKHHVTEVGVVKGKVQYMAPEQYTGGEVDHRADIFSLGVVLYQLTTGRLPRATKDGSISMKRVIEGKIPPPSEIRPDFPEALETIVMRALAHEKDDRYSDAGSLRDDLLDFARQHDMLAFPKELADYVNELVPMEKDPEDDVPTAPKNRKGVDLKEAEAADTVGHGTERVTAAGKRSIITSDVRSDPFGRTEIPIETEQEERAVLTDEQPTPSPEKRRSNRERLQKLGPVADARSRDGPVDSGDHPRGEQEARERQGGRTFALAAVMAGLVLLVAAAVVLPELLGNGDDQRDVEKPRKPGAAVAGRLLLSAYRANATVSGDGAQRCDKIPCEVKGLPLGTLMVTVRADGYRLWNQRVVLTSKEPSLKLHAMLEPFPDASGGSSPDAGTKKTPAKTKKHPGKRHPGKRHPGKRHPGKRQPGKTGPKGRPSKGAGVVRSTKSEVPGCWLVVDVRPSWAEVWLDGQKLGNTPLMRGIKPGRHKIELKNPMLGYHVYYRIRAKNGFKVKIADTIRRR